MIEKERTHTDEFLGIGVEKGYREFPICSSFFFLHYKIL